MEPLWKQITDRWIEYFHSAMKNPKYRGEKFDASKFDAADFILGAGMISFRRIPSKKTQEKMAIRAVELWKKLESESPIIK